jgi:hypothetical protein
MLGMTWDLPTFQPKHPLFGRPKSHTFNEICQCKFHRHLMDETGSFEGAGLAVEVIALRE